MNLKWHQKSTIKIDIKSNFTHALFGKDKGIDLLMTREVR